MILQIANIVAGFVLALPGLKNWGGKESLEKIEANVHSMKENIGLVTLVLGLIGLVDRTNIISFHIVDFGSSYPQALPTILTGALLALPKLERFPAIATQVKKLLPYTFGLGLLSMAVGLGSLLFGCIMPLFCRVPF